MKKEELKKEFEEKLKNITVSDELKERTLNNIYSKNNVYHLPYWIKNCAAVFVVTCLCLSIYVVNNKNIFSKSSNDEFSPKLHTGEYFLQSTDDTAVKFDTLPECKMMIKSSSPLNELESSYYTPENTLNNITDGLMRSSSFSAITQDLANSYNDSATTEIPEEEFLRNNPDAKKTENGYSIIKDNVEIFYELKDGFVYELK